MMDMRTGGKIAAALMLACALGLTQGCDRETKKPAEAPKAQHTAANAGQNMPQGASVSGKVVETMDSGGYTYVCVEKDGKREWAAVPQMKVAVGDPVELIPGVVMHNFTSRTLNRTFDEIVFSSGCVAGGGAATPTEGQAAPAAAPSASMPMDQASNATDMTGGPHGREVPVAESGIKVEKAQGPDAYTVGEIYEKRAALAGHKVVIRGSVVKVATGIMGKNWIHIQDGTGDAASGHHDLVATSTDLPSVGDVVVVSGTLASDKDFGYGYHYEAIVEDAHITSGK